MVRILLLLLMVISVPGLAQDSLVHRVLFVGNSYTYFWNLPQSVDAMASSQGYNITIRQSTAGGTNLGQHWRGEKSLETVHKITSGEFDKVILQDHSLQAINHPDSLLIYGKKLGELAQDQGAELYLYMTWARKWDPFMQEPIAQRYQQLAEELGAQIIPVGPAWQRSAELRPDVELFHPDSSHPSPQGTYLTACVMYAVLTGSSPVGLPPRLTTIDANGELLYLNIQTAEDAKFLQQVAEEVVEEMNSQDNNN